MSDFLQRADEAINATYQRIGRQAALQKAVHEAMLEQSADEFCSRLLFRIKEFEKNLDNKHEVGARLVCFGQAITIHVEKIGSLNPALIIFRGVTSEGEIAELVQHVNQISFLLVTLKALNPKMPRRVMGFAAAKQED